MHHATLLENILARQPGAFLPDFPVIINADIETMKLILESSFTTVTQDTISLPNGKKPEDIAACFRKWDSVTISFKDGSTLNVDVESIPENNTEDCKRPDTVLFNSETGEEYA